MTQLYMDTDQLRNSLANIHVVHSQMIEQVQNMTQQIDYLVGVAWQAPAAMHFGNDFSYCQQTIMFLLDDMEELIIGLNREISEWEEAGNSFNRFGGDNSQTTHATRYFTFSG